MSETSIDWHQKYKSMKKKLKELRYIRTDAVLNDCEDLKKKIDEHKAVHGQTLEEIRAHNDDLRNTIDEIEKMKSEIMKMENKITSVKRDIGLRDAVLRVLIDYPFFKVRISNPGVYSISINSTKKIQFTLEKQQKDFLYVPIQIPMIQNIPDIMSKEMIVKNEQLNKFCQTWKDIVQNAEDM